MKQTLWSIGMLCLLAGLTGCAKKQIVPPPPPPPPAPVVVEPKAPEPTPEPAPEPAPAPAPAPQFEFRTVHFAYDSYSIPDADKALLAEVARSMRNNSVLKLTLEGHCDERGTIEYNLALGEKRAKAVRDYLVGQGIDQGRFTVTSYGKERPVAYGNDESSWAQNRRVEGRP